MKKFLFIILCASTLNGMKNLLTHQHYSDGIMGPEMPLDLKELIIVDYVSDHLDMRISSNVKDLLVADYLSTYSIEISSELKDPLVADYLETFANSDPVLQKEIQKTSIEKEIQLILKDIQSMSLTNKDLNQIVNNQSLFTKLLHKLAGKFNMRTNIIIKYFKVPAVKTYQKLGLLLICACGSKDWAAKVPEIIEQGADININFTGRFTPLYTAVYLKNAELLKLLLDLGAKPILDECHQKANNIFFDLKEKIGAKKKDQM